MLQAVQLVLRLAARGLLFVGLPCGSHIWVSSSQHQRSHEMPLGDQTFPFVVDGNILAYRSAICIVIGIIRGAVWALENPQNSKFKILPVFGNILANRLLHTMTIQWWLVIWGG